MLFQGPDDVAVLSKLPQPADNEELLDIEALREPSRGLRTALEHADDLRGQGRLRVWRIRKAVPARSSGFLLVFDQQSTSTTWPPALLAWLYLGPREAFRGISGGASPELVTVGLWRRARTDGLTIQIDRVR